MVRSTSLIVTGTLSMLSTHVASQGAGQMRPVTSGKLFVECRTRTASAMRPRYTRSLNSGMTLPSGQPWWQNGIPQSMQREACARSSLSGGSTTNSW